MKIPTNSTRGFSADVEKAVKIVIDQGISIEDLRLSGHPEYQAKVVSAIRTKVAALEGSQGFIKKTEAATPQAKASDETLNEAESIRIYKEILERTLETIQKLKSMGIRHCPNWKGICGSMSAHLTNYKAAVESTEIVDKGDLNRMTYALRLFVEPILQSVVAGDLDSMEKTEAAEARAAVEIVRGIATDIFALLALMPASDGTEIDYTELERNFRHTIEHTPEQLKPIAVKRAAKMSDYGRMGECQVEGKVKKIEYLPCYPVNRNQKFGLGGARVGPAFWLPAVKDLPPCAVCYWPALERDSEIQNIVTILNRIKGAHSDSELYLRDFFHEYYFFLGTGRDNVIKRNVIPLVNNAWLHSDELFEALKNYLEKHFNFAINARPGVEDLDTSIRGDTIGMERKATTKYPSRTNKKGLEIVIPEVRDENGFVMQKMMCLV